MSSSAKPVLSEVEWVTNAFRAKWAADAEAALRTTVDTASLTGKNPFQTILGAVSA